jgi:hypothetical protein
MLTPTRRYHLDKNFASLAFDGDSLRMKIHGAYSTLIDAKWSLAELDSSFPEAAITGADYDEEEGGGWQCHSHRGRVSGYDPTLIAGWLTCVLWVFSLALAPFFLAFYVAAKALRWAWRWARGRRGDKDGAYISACGSSDSGSSVWSIRDAAEMEELILKKEE